MTVAAPLQFDVQPARALLDDPGLRTRWDQLNCARMGVSVLTADAVAAALEVFGHGTERLVCARRSGQVDAMAVVLPQGRGRWATFQPSQMPLGTWVAQTDIALQDLARQMLRRALPAFSLALSFTQVDPRLAPREADSTDNRHDDYIPTSWLAIEGSFDTYWGQRGKNLRQNMRKQRNKLAADGTLARMQMLCQPDAMAPALLRYGRMESTGWKASQGTAIHPDNDQGRFYLQLLQGAAARGEALVTEYLFGDTTVAMNLGLLRNGEWVVLKTTYDESIGKALSPASLLREDELQAFFADGLVKRIEYYGRTMDWHTKLTEQQRVLYHLTTYRWPVLKRWVERRHAARSKDAEVAAPAPVAEPDAAT